MNKITSDQLTKRRKILKMIVLGLTASLTSTQMIAKNHSHKKRKVIVIGAGVSGLAASQYLHSFGFEVLVLEARNRLGGRIWSDETLGFPVDLGASWIQRSSGNPITKLAKQFNVKTYSDNDDWIFYESNGQVMSDSSMQYFEESIEEMESLIEELMYELDHDISIQQAVDRILANESLTHQEKKYLDVFLSSLESSTGASTRDKSLFYPESDAEFSGQDHLFPDGYAQIIKGLSQNLKIHLSQTVKQVTQTNNGVKVSTESTEFTADNVIVTVPLGVLKAGKIRFSPELNPAKKKAIQRLKMGLLNKIVMKFPKVFWPKETTKFGYVSETKGEFPAVINWYKVSGHPVLMSFVAADFARKLESLSDAEIINKQMKILRKVFGNDIPEPEKYVISRWASDPQSFGSYSYAAVGVSDKNYDQLADPMGLLFFAGEATNKKYSATVHGAYLSGIRAAKELINS